MGSTQAARSSWTSPPTDACRRPAAAIMTALSSTAKIASTLLALRRVMAITRHILPKVGLVASVVGFASCCGLVGFVLLVFKTVLVVGS